MESVATRKKRKGKCLGRKTRVEKARRKKRMDGRKGMREGNNERKRKQEREEEERERRERSVMTV